MKLKNLKIILHLSAMLSVITVIVFCFAFSRNEDTEIDKEVSAVSIEHYYIDNILYKPQEFPIKVSFTKGTPIQFKFTLPKEVTGDYAISFQSVYCGCEVYAEKELIYSYGTNMPLSVGHMVGNIHVIVPLTDKLAGATITVKLTPYYSVPNVNLSAIKLATSAGIKYDILANSIPKIIIIVILTTIAIISMILFCNQFFGKTKLNLLLYGNFFLMDICVILWLTCSSDIPQFFTNQNETVAMISFICLSCMAIPYTRYCEQIFPRHKKLFSILQVVGYLVPLANAVCFMTGLADPMSLLALTHIYMVAAVLSSFIVVLLEPNKNREAIFLIVGISILMVASFVGLICYYLSPASGIDGFFFGIGFICFITALFLIILTRQVNLIKERQHLDTYKTLAYNDIMTSLGNRSSFENCFATMAQRVPLGDPVTLFMFDLNGLKTTNDNFGHQAGDDLIKTMAQKLDASFSRYGTCYRLGGDEFAVVVERMILNVEDIRANFNSILCSTQLECGVILSASVGIATLPFSSSPSFRDEIFSRADAAMYVEKKKFHSSGEADRRTT